MERFTKKALRKFAGDGTGATHTVAGSGITGAYSVYGQIPALQNAYVGSYSDSVVVTVTF